jgi:hypothetical protein
MMIPRAEVYRRDAWETAKTVRLEKERIRKEEEERARREQEREQELRALRRAAEEAELEAARKLQAELRGRKGPQPTPEEELMSKKSWADQCEEERKKRMLEARYVPSSRDQLSLSGSDEEKTSEESDSSDETEKEKKSKKKKKEPSPKFSEEEEEKGEEWKKVSKKRKKKSASKSPKAKCGEDKKLPKEVNRGDSACSTEATGDDGSEAGPSRGRRGAARPGPSTELQDEFADEELSVNRQEANARLVDPRRQQNEDEARRLLDDDDVQMVDD